MQAGEASRQVAQQALLPGALLHRHPSAARVHRGVRGGVPAGVAQGMVGVDALQKERSSSLCVNMTAASTKAVSLVFPLVTTHTDTKQAASPKTLGNLTGFITPNTARRTAWIVTH